jgi:segregation and condensation protein B
METLALVVYKQPITRAEIEDVRGVSVSSNIMKVLQEREWVKIVGHKEVPGRPAMFATTKKFLDYFNLQSLSELPSLADIKEFDQIVPELDFGQELPLVADQETDLDTESEFEPESRKESSQESSQENEQHLDHSDEEYNDDVNLASQDEAHAITQTLSDDDLSEDSSEDQLEENVAEQQASNELDELDPHTEIKH